MTNYQLSGEGYVIRDGDTKVPTADTFLIPNKNPDFLAYKEWIASGNAPLPAAPTAEELAETRKRAFDELREFRVPMLNAVAGIMSTAVFEGDVALAEEAATIRQKLLDITLDPVLLAAVTYDEMKMAGQRAYRVIAKSASPQFAAVFKETTGA